MLAGLPAVVVGALLHDMITALYANTLLICVMLIVGGIILLYVDQLKLTPKYTDIYAYPPLLCLYIGLFQVLSLVPGVSRSGSTIVGSLLLGTDKRSAAEFSFFLAIPIMVGAFGYDAFKNRALITSSLGLTIAIGFALAFITAFFVIRYALAYIQRHGFAPFAYWRIFVGALGFGLCCCSSKSSGWPNEPPQIARTERRESYGWPNEPAYSSQSVMNRSDWWMQTILIRPSEITLNLCGSPAAT